jgi:hypothetical protein
VDEVIGRLPDGIYDCKTSASLASWPRRDSGKTAVIRGHEIGFSRQGILRAQMRKRPSTLRGD